MDYKNKIQHSQDSGFVPISAIWDGTTKVEQIGIDSCKAYYKERGYGLLHEPKKYHPQYDLKFGFKDDTISIEAKTEPFATGVFHWDDDPSKRTFDTCFVEYKDKSSKHPDLLTGLSLTEADFYWFHTGGGVFQVPTQQVKDWGHSNVKHVWGGINKNSLGFKLPVKWMEEYRVQ